MRLPEGISVDKKLRDGRVVYVILTEEGDEIGGIFVNGTRGGNTHLDPFLNEQLTRYSLDEKRRLVADIAQQMTDALIKYEAAKPEHLRNKIILPEVPAGTQVIEGKYFTCSKCGNIVARLIFSPTAAAETEMLTFGQNFRDIECISVDYPVWIIGAPEPEKSSEDAKHWTLKISPALGKVYLEHPDKMNDRLIMLDDSHC